MKPDTFYKNGEVMSVFDISIGAVEYFYEELGIFTAVNDGRDLTIGVEMPLSRQAKKGQRKI